MKKMTPHAPKAPRPVEQHPLGRADEGARDVQSVTPQESAEPLSVSSDSSSTVPSLSHHVRPFSQRAEPLPPADPELFEQARAAVQAIRGRGRRADGTFGEGNTAAMKHGLTSLQLLDHPDIRAWHQARVEAIVADLGGEAELSALQQGLVREVARLEVVVAALGDDLLEHGAITGKGATRAATNVWLAGLDRYARLAGQLGLSRRTKQVTTFSEAVRGPR